MVLMKCRPGDEDTIRTLIEKERQRNGVRRKQHICLRGDQDHECVREAVAIMATAYCFGPFDFLFVVRSRHIHQIERFVVECVRGDAKRIEDTHTIVGLTI